VPIAPDQDPAGRGPRLRASDAERLAAARIVQDGVARGCLRFEEGGERLAAVWASRWRDELPPLTADLPPAPVPAPPPDAAPGWQTLGTLAMAQVRHSLARTPTGNPRLNRAIAVAAVLLTLLVFIGLATAAAHAGFDGPHNGGGWPHGPRGPFDGG
jgi:hypothetical protein